MRQTLHELAATHRLQPLQTRQLWQLAGLHPQPAQATRWLFNGLALAAALLLGAGLIFWVAANWQAQTRQFKFWLLLGAMLAPAAAALLAHHAQRALRNALLLLATLALGGLLAFIGQTYQTGADAWQLFAVWAALALPWVLAARSDGLWALWLLVLGAALAMWSGQTLFDPLANLLAWRSQRHWLYSPLWLGVLAVALALPASGWVEPARAAISLRLAALMALVAWTGYGLWYLFDGGLRGSAPMPVDPWLLYALNVVLVALLAFAAWWQRPRDLVTLGLALLALNVLFLAQVSQWLFAGKMGTGDLIGPVLMFALVAAATVGFSGSWLYRLQREGRA